MNLEIPVDKETLRALGSALPLGGIAEVAKRVGYSQGYVGRFFNGDYNVTNNNKKIIDEARKVIAEQNKLAESIAKDINESLTNPNP